MCVSGVSAYTASLTAYAPAEWRGGSWRNVWLQSKWRNNANKRSVAGLQRRRRLSAQRHQRMALNGGVVAMAKI